MLPGLIWQQVCKDLNIVKEKKSMSQVAVQKIDGDQTEAGSLFEEMKSLGERIRQRAYDIFQTRGCGDGAAVDDWLKAERDLIFTPKSDLVEKNGKLELQVTVPGFEPKDVRVTALPDALIVRAESTHKHEKTDENVCFCEFGEKSLFRRFDLPVPIDVNKVTANLDKGVLKLTAAKAESASPKSVTAA
jgi:HSP20 family protein